jgi:hypothetical protein
MSIEKRLLSKSDQGKTLGLGFRQMRDVNEGSKHLTRRSV